MTIEELRELFSDMLSKDLEPMLCDTEVPKYDTKIPCGEPTMCYGDSGESVLLPKELLSMHPEFMIPVRGDSISLCSNRVEVGKNVGSVGYFPCFSMNDAVFFNPHRLFSLCVVDKTNTYLLGKNR